MLRRQAITAHGHITPGQRGALVITMENGHLTLGDSLYKLVSGRPEEGCSSSGFTRPIGVDSTMNFKRSVAIFLLLVLAGCATVPTGPSVMVLPAPGKSFGEFQAEDANCKWWASQQSGLSTQETVNQNTLSAAVIGTVIGAGLGAAIGAISANPGMGAAVGAGSGLLGGTISGANAGQGYAWEAQRRYDIAYQQCMYAKGNQVAGSVQ